MSPSRRNFQTITETFKKFIPDRTYGFYQSSIKDIKAYYLFASIMTIGKKSELEKFDKKQFDYIVVDEFHHAGAKAIEIY